ncbi:MAG: glutamyl-tRNA reductase [Thiomonas delicata]|jgi:glutamyl-tRNA reductase|uniref:Glutamyl-tRNA reductase n=1 Tax=Thiomonas delicata TaxID=364030 RepID=A0A238D1M6_THIDL|nr:MULTISPECIES: glutamyl-tRNA reductase [Thiomonas]SBP87152.1 glutamyl tRNA reductase [Thiomonas delicata]
MLLAAVGVNHQTAPLDVRERLAFSADSLKEALRTLRDSLLSHRPSGDGPVEAAILSTCNRTEIYCATSADPREALVHWLAQSRALSEGELSSHSYRLVQDDTVRHAFRVASGLDSMVLGEPQILGQMKDAVRAAADTGTLGSTLGQMFQRTFAVAKEVRSTTEIGAHSVSMAAASVKLAETVFENLADCRVLFIGAGDMIELVATHFAARKPRHMAIANRTLERGARLAQQFGGEAMRLADVPQRLAEFDVVITSTASTLPIIGLGAAERMVKQRRHKPVVMVDLAVPRDIEAEVGELADVYLYSVDDLTELVRTNSEKRQAAVEQAESIIESRVQGFLQWMDSREQVPLILQLQEQSRQWQNAELERARRMLARGESPEAVMDMLARNLSQKFMHNAYAAMHHTDPDHREQVARAVQRLFLTPHRGCGDSNNN